MKDMFSERKGIAIHRYYAKWVPWEHLVASKGIVTYGKVCLGHKSEFSSHSPYPPKKEEREEEPPPSTGKQGSKGGGE